jgi:hypothetical protein
MLCRQFSLNKEVLHFLHHSEPLLAVFCNVSSFYKYNVSQDKGKDRALKTATIIFKYLVTCLFYPKNSRGLPHCFSTRSKIIRIIPPNMACIQFICQSGICVSWAKCELYSPHSLQVGSLSFKKTKQNQIITQKPIVRIVSKR